MTPVRILMVDDHSANLLALEAILADTGYELVPARSGAEALKALLQQEFALILMDVMMPDMDGYETAELIRRRESSRYTPIISSPRTSEATRTSFAGTRSAPSTTCSSPSYLKCSCGRSRSSSICTRSSRP